MGCGREMRPSEKEWDRAENEMRTLDKMLWSGPRHYSLAELDYDIACLNSHICAMRTAYAKECSPAKGPEIKEG